MTSTETTEQSRCKQCLRVHETDKPDQIATCGCHITEPHQFVSGYGMRTCWECGKGGSATIHKIG